MIIVSNTSPINNLAGINQLDLIRQLYSSVIIPNAVYQELTSSDFPVAGAIEVQTLDWISRRQVNNRSLVDRLKKELDLGEAEAIALALELNADRLLIDERRGRVVAARLNLEYTGVLGILVEAKSQGIISSVKPLLDALINRAGFWVSESIYNDILQLAGESD